MNKGGDSVSVRVVEFISKLKGIIRRTHGRKQEDVTAVNQEYMNKEVEYLNVEFETTMTVR